MEKNVQLKGVKKIEKFRIHKITSQKIQTLQVQKQ